MALFYCQMTGQGEKRRVLAVGRQACGAPSPNLSRRGGSLKQTAYEIAGLALRRRAQRHVDVNGRKGAYHAAALTAFDEAQLEQLLHVLVHALHIAPDPA